MKAKNKNTSREIDELFRKTAEDIRRQSIESSVVKGAADRVWAKLSSEGVKATGSAAPSLSSVDERHIRNCDDFQALIPAYLSGSLSESRVILFEDHTHECVGCRKALREARYGARPGIDQYKKQSRLTVLSKPVVRWAIAATLVLTVGLVFYERISRVSDAFNTIVFAMDGPVYTVSSNDTHPLAVGDKVPQGEKIRCAKDAGAVMKLHDGSLIEMRERSEFSVSNNSDGTTIHLDRGNIIVQAAKQPRDQHLYVQTGDCLVEVKGTIFSVNSGTKGSRVSVVEGEVHVDHAGRTDVLLPGQQVTTSPAIERVAVKDEVAWSRDRERYAKMLAEVAALRRDVDAGATMPEARYSTRLLDMAPEQTVIYIAIPNITATLKESQKIIDERLAQNADLREWWQKEQASGGRREWNQAISKISEFGDYLGDEIVVCAQLDSRGEPAAPVVLATLKDPSGFRTFAERQIAALSLYSKKAPPIKFVDDLSANVQSDKAEMYASINGNVLVGAPDLASIKAVAANSGGFAKTSFYSKIADIYREGAGFIIAADLERIIGAQRKSGSKESAALKQLGILDLKHFIVEIKDDQGKPSNRAVLSFNPSDHGIASWLAAPGPMGALRFISPDANVVAAFVVKQPSALVDDLLSAMNTVDPQLQQHLSQFESETGLNIRNDLAAPLGGEFAFAVDGPLLPTPSWKLVFEVYDSAHLQSTIERLVDSLNQLAASQGKGGFQLESSESGGLIYYTLKSVDLGVEVDYTYTDGYLVACPSKALVDRAVRNQEAGYTLLRSERFVSALPGDKHPNFSALVYHNLGAVLSPLARRVRGVTEELPEDQRGALKSLAANAPVLGYAYAYGDRITFAVNGENGPVGLNPSDLLGMPGSFGLQSIIGGAMGK
jgi:hypothetical protein